MENNSENLLGLKNQVERIHTEAKQFRSETSNTMHAFDKRIERLAFEGEDRDEKVKELDGQVKEFHGKINMPWYKLAAYIAPALIAVATAIYSVTWTLAHVPTGEKFEQMQHDVYEIGAQQRILDGKLDLLLRKTP